MLTEFIITSLIFAILAGLMFGLVLTIDLSGVERIITTIIIALVIGCIFGLVHCEQEYKWNDGYCRQCGEKWELFDIDRSTYYYKDNNGHIINWR